MKALKIISLFLIGTGTLIYTTIQKVPDKVKEAFTGQFPNVTSIRWEKESETEWEADFKLKDVKYSANFLEDGTWLETEYEIDVKDIPKNIRRALKKEFPGYEIDEAEKLQTSEGGAYEFEIEKGDDEMEIIMDMNGKVLRKEIEEEDEDDGQF